ncbi:MAG: EAL domain-containing protein, partial [Candidatus Edwardsbacteria bacterium]|nr:EAL domain-containing protein [Candidatus Edwardsbacteria bacterium]
MSQELQKDYFELKVETLRLKSQLYDKGTKLPTMPAVLEEARKLAEIDGALGVIVLSIDQPGRIEEIYGWEAFDRMLTQTALIMETALAVARVQHLTALSGIRSNRQIIFVKTNSNPDEQLRALQKTLEAALAKASLIPGLPTRDIMVFGRSLIRLDSKVRFERQVYYAVDRASQEALERSEDRQDAVRVRLRSILDGNQLVTLFQPIIELVHCTVFGHEALSRGPDGSGFENAELLFSFAEQTDLVFDLERRCRENALFLGRADGRKGKLFINTSVKAMYGGEFRGDKISKLVSRARLNNRDVVFEITERIAIYDWKSFTKIVADLKANGFMVAIDDLGSGYSSLKLLAEVQPDFLKFDVSLIHGIDKNLMKLELVKTLIALAQSMNAR